MAFHIMAKPVGPICNLACRYCFYLEKRGLYSSREQWKMPDAVLESYIRQYIEAQDGPEVCFAWQGGEPTLLGVPFFRRAVEFQRQYAGGKRISNAFQTNGTLLDDEWCFFLRENSFLVGLSIDGPADLHDAYRVDRHDRPTFAAVMRGLELLRKHKVEFNTLTVVNAENSRRPLEVYRFLKGIGSTFLQFIPLVERRSEGDGDTLAEPPTKGSEAISTVTPWSVAPAAYGDFLIAIFDEWVRTDVGRVFVQLFDVALGNWVGAGSSLCVFAERCGAAMALEHNGDLYACDHYVYPAYKLGNLLATPLGEMASSPQQRQFGEDKLATLPRFCRECEVRFACNGDCPKHRFAQSPDGEAGLSYLCPAYKRFFKHIDLPMRTMAGLLRAGRPPADIMKAPGRASGGPARAAAPARAGRNDPCPCGSGLKYKKCCLKT